MRMLQRSLISLKLLVEGSIAKETFLKIKVKGPVTMIFNRLLPNVVHTLVTKYTQNLTPLYNDNIYFQANALLSPMRSCQVSSFECVSI